MEHHIDLWPSLHRPLRSWVEQALSAQPRHFPLQTHIAHNRIFLFTDSSDNGWGAVLVVTYPAVEIFISFAAWDVSTQQRHINDKEALASWKGCRELLHLWRTTPLVRKNTSLHLVVDSSSWCGSAQAIFPKKWLSLWIRREITKLVLQHDLLGWDISWVDTLSQLADIFTRLKLRTNVEPAVSQVTLDPQIQAILWHTQLSAKRVSQLLLPHMPQIAASIW